MYHVAALLVFLLSFPPETVSTLDLCNPQSFLSSNVSSYKYKDQPVQNCGCPVRTSCVRKCCAAGFYASKGVCLASDSDLNIPVFRGEDLVRNVSLQDKFLAGVMKCNFFRYESNSKDSFHLQEDGTLLTSVYGLLTNDYYCVDYIKAGNKTSLGTFICFGRNGDVELRKVNDAGMIISTPFLLATFIVYALLPDRNLHMKALMFYVISLLFSYILLVVIQLTDSRFSEEVCTTIGYACLFFFLVSFFWMNVICIDIWLAFSGLRGFSGSKKIAERKRFLIYCGYALGAPVLHVIIIIIIHNTAERNAWYAPGIGEAQCFLNRGFPELLYFYGPMAILITMNVVLFTITAFKIRRVKKDTSMLKKEDSKRHSYENDKQTYNLYLKLLFAMGVNWSMEIVSWAVIWADTAPEFVWYLTDFCNAIYGVFIFFIFVCKKSIWKLLKKRYYSFVGKPHLAHSMTMSNTTRVTSYSTANSSVTENPQGANDRSTLTSEA